MDRSNGKKGEWEKGKSFFFLSLSLDYLPIYLHPLRLRCSAHAQSHGYKSSVCVCVCERKQRIDPPVRWRIYVVLARPKHAAMLKKISMLL